MLQLSIKIAKWYLSLHWPAIAGLVHEAPLHASREASSTSPTQARNFDLIENPVDSLQKNLLSFVPVATLQSPIQPVAQIWEGHNCVFVC